MQCAGLLLDPKRSPVQSAKCCSAVVSALLLPDHHVKRQDNLGNMCAAHKATVSAYCAQSHGIALAMHVQAHIAVACALHVFILQLNLALLVLQGTHAR